MSKGNIEDDFLAGDLLLDEIDDMVNHQQSDADSDDSIEGDDSLPYDIDDEASSSIQSSDNAKLDEEGNEFYLLGKHWQETGIIPDSVKLNPNITSLELEDIYREVTRENVVAQIRTEISDSLISKGLNPDEIFNLSNDLDAAFLKQYQAISQLTFDELYDNSEDITDSVRRIGKEYYYSKMGENVSEDEVDALVEIDFQKLSDEDAFDKYISQFSKQAKALEHKIANKNAERVKREEAKAKEDYQSINKWLETSGLSSKEQSIMKDAITKKNEIYDNGNGVRRRVTLFEKRRLESEEDIRKQLEIAKFLIFGIDESKLKEQSERVGTFSTLDKIAKASGIVNTNIKNKNGWSKKVDDALFID